MTTLVTGASGHLGAHVVRHLLAQGRAVRALVRPTSNLQGLAGLEVELVRGDVLDRSSLLSALHGCSAVYHLAAVVAGWAHDPAVIYKTAIDGTANILQAVANTSGIAAYHLYQFGGYCGYYPPHPMTYGTNRTTTPKTLAITRWPRSGLSSWPRS